jgi:hypothetical protein
VRQVPGRVTRAFRQGEVGWRVGVSCSGSVSCCWLLLGVASLQAQDPSRRIWQHLSKRWILRLVRTRQGSF